MDLDELKYQLKAKLSADHAGRSNKDIAALLNKRTHSIIGKLKKSLWMEIIFGILITVGFGLIGIMSKYVTLRIYFSIFAVMCAAFIVLLIYLLRRITHLSSSTLPVKSNLQTIVNIIEEFIKRYFQFTMALIPVCFIFSFLLGYNEPEPVPEVDGLAKSIFSAAWQVVVFLVIYMAALTVGIYYFTKWYLKKLYGKYMDQMKECIAELTED